MKVKDLKKDLANCDDDADVVLGFYLKDEANHFVYLADVLTLKYDGVKKEKTFNSTVVELLGFDDEYATYVEVKDDK